MCGRYTITKSIEEICNTFEVEQNNELFSSTYNITPNQKLPIITNQNQNLDIKKGLHNEGLFITT